MPGSLGEALEELERDEVVRDALGEHVFGHFIEAKRAEWDDFRLHVSQWELDRYLEAF
jgi:glutamine synthetase